MTDTQTKQQQDKHTLRAKDFTDNSNQGIVDDRPMGTHLITHSIRSSLNHTHRIRRYPLYMVQVLDQRQRQSR